MGIEDHKILMRINLLLKENKIPSPSIIINNSGGPEPKSPLNVSELELQKYLQSGFLGFVRVVQEYAPLMMKKKWGRIINIGSTVSKEPTPFMTTSASIRSALIAYSKALSLELASKGITVNTISLGGVLTTRIKKLFSKIAKEEGVTTNTKIKHLC